MKRKALGCNSKKGMIGSFLGITIVLLAFAIMSIVGLVIFNEMNEDFQTDSGISNSTKQEVDNLYNRTPTTLDGIFLFIFVGLWIIALLMAWLSENSIALVIVVIVVMIFLLIVAAIFSNTYEEISTDDTLITFSSQFPYTDYILTNFLMMVLVVIFSTMLVMYFKYR